jgi:hypothetical protein
MPSANTSQLHIQAALIRRVSLLESLQTQRRPIETAVGDVAERWA